MDIEDWMPPYLQQARGNAVFRGLALHRPAGRMACPMSIKDWVLIYLKHARRQRLCIPCMARPAPLSPWCVCTGQECLRWASHLGSDVFCPVMQHAVLLHASHAGAADGGAA